MLGKMCFSKFIDFCNINSGFIQAIFSFLIVIVTLVYVVINLRMFYEMKKTREMSEIPEISIRLKKRMSGFYDIVVENISDIPVFELKFLNSPDLPLYGNKTTKDIGFFKDGIKYMAPHQSYVSFFFDYHNVDVQFQTIEFQFEYKNRQNKIFKQNFEINLSLFYDKGSLGKSFNENLIEELKKIRNSINSLKQKERNH